MVPVSYLRRFTLEGEADGTLHVLDLYDARSWKSSPKNAACVHDFYKTDAEVPDPHRLEKELGRVEGILAPLLCDVGENRRIPSDPIAKDNLLLFVALQAVRTAAVRETFHTAARMHLRQILDHWTEDEERFWDGVDVIRRENEDFAVRGTFEQIKAAVREGGVDVEFNRAEVLKETLGLLEYVLADLREKHWSAVIPDTYSGWFVTSDNPLALLPRKPERPGEVVKWVLPRDIYFPLSKDLALVGIAKALSPPRVLNRDHVGIVNFHAVFGARFTFSPVERYAVALADHTTGTGQQLASNVCRAREGTGAG